jgi:hypothetical protein
MKQQVFVIHGGDVFSSREAFIETFKKWTFSLDDLRKVGWKENLQSDLGESYEVLRAKMPNKENANYEEWKVYFEKFLPLLDDGIIFIGHSLGGIFLVKYFSEHTSPKRIKSMFFVAAPGPDDEAKELKEFTVKSDLALLTSQCTDMHFYHSRDDKVVDFANYVLYKSLVPQGHFRVFEDWGHFNQEHLPQIVEDIASL